MAIRVPSTTKPRRRQTTGSMRWESASKRPSNSRSWNEATLNSILSSSLVYSSLPMIWLTVGVKNGEDPRGGAAIDRPCLTERRMRPTSSLIASIQVPTSPTSDIGIGSTMGCRPRYHPTHDVNPVSGLDRVLIQSNADVPISQESIWKS